MKKFYRKQKQTEWTLKVTGFEALNKMFKAKGAEGLEKLREYEDIDQDDEGETEHYYDIPIQKMSELQEYLRIFDGLVMFLDVHYEDDIIHFTSGLNNVMAFDNVMLDQEALSSELTGRIGKAIDVLRGINK